MSSVESKILKQVEFYFGNSNLLKDKFLSGLIAKNDEGWVEIAIIASFARMKAMTTDLKVVESALRKSESLLVVNDDGDKVRRALSLDGVEYKESHWIYAKGFAEDATLEAIESFWGTKGTVLCVRMRRFRDTSKFKGSVFVEFKDEEEAKKVLAEEHKLENATENLKVMTKTDYLAAKKLQYEEKKAARNGKKGEKRSATDEPEVEEVMAEPVLNLLTKVSGLPDTSSREDLKETFQSIGALVRYVDHNRGLTEGFVRLQDDDPMGAKAVAAKLTESKTLCCGVVPTYTPLEGEEELNYWKQLFEKRKARKKMGDGGKRKKRRRF